MKASGQDPDDRHPLTYRDAGVDIDAQDEGLRRIKDALRATRTPGVLADLGAFGGLFRPDLTGLREPVLVSSCDGVGTKLRIAFEMGVHDTIGRDLVNHCVNDILVQGAKPLFFLDYFAAGKLDPGVFASVVQGIARGCKEAGCALLGGETAEMPGFYPACEYDLAGFIVGLVDKDKVLDGSRVRAGDILLGLASAGLHTNGYSLARRILFDRLNLSVSSSVAELGGTVGEALLAEHRSYLRVLTAPLAAGTIEGLAHITGGGLSDNLPRILPRGTQANIRRASWPVPPIFEFLARAGEVEDAEMLRAFNMGIGMVMVVRPERVAEVEAPLRALGERHWRIGTVSQGDGFVHYE